MELRINKISLENFKGAKKKEIVLNGKSARLCAQNGGFKTTFSDSYFWTFSNCNTAMVNNPDAVPVDAEEAKPTVEIEMTIDGKPVSVKKVQTFKRKDNTSSISNTYYINDVEKSQKDFIADLTERGIDMENFLTFSNPNAFMADTSKQGREKMRNILFKMCEDISDEQIISGMENVDELKALLENYKLDECEQMQKSTLKKINDEFGKDNQIVQARISGIIQSKSQIDVEDTKKKKTEYEAELEQVCKDAISLKSSDSSIEGKIAELLGKQDDLERKSRIELENRNALLSEKLRKAEHACEEASFKHQQSIWESQRTFSEWENCRDSLNNYRELYKKVQDEVFDEKLTVCPSCGRSFPADEVETMKKSFEESKKKRLDEYKSKGEGLSKQYDALTKEHEDARIAEEKANKAWHKADDKVQKLTEEYQMSPRTPNMNDNEEYKKIQSEIESLRSQLGKTDALKLQELSNKESYLLQMIKQMDAELTLFERNKELDHQIAELRKQQKDAEIRRADAEKVLDQVDRFKREKNEKLTSDINSHFNIIKFKLFDFQKNGNYVETVEILIDDKPITSCANGSLIQLAKLDCLAGLQNYFNQHIPVFLEDAALITSNTADRLKLDSQLIQLVAVEGVKEMVVDIA